MRRFERGFTVVELMLAVLILVLLAGIVVGSIYDRSNSNTPSGPAVTTTNPCQGFPSSEAGLGGEKVKTSTSVVGGHCLSQIP